MIKHTDLPLVLDPGAKEYRDRFFEVFSRFQPLYPEVFHVRNSTRPDDTIVAVTDVAEPALRNEGDPIATKEYAEAWSETFTHLEYSAKFTMSNTMFDDLTPDMKSAYPALYSIAAASKIEDLAWTVLKEAFTTNGPDGQPLCDDAHPLAYGGTADNKGTTALSAAAISVARAAIRRWRSEQGRINVIGAPKFLIVPPELEATAQAAAQAGANLADLKVDDANVVARMGLQVLVVPWLTDVTDWFLVHDPAMFVQGLEFWERAAPDFMSGFDGENRYYWGNTTMRYSAGHTWFPQVWGASVAG